MTDTAPSKPATSRLTLLWSMLTFLGPVKWHMTAALTIFLMGVLAEILTVYYLKFPIDMVKALTEAPARAAFNSWEWFMASDGSGAGLRWALLTVLLWRLIHSLLIWLQSLSFSYASMQMAFYMRAAVYDRLQRVGFAFHDRYSTGQLINRALQDLQAVRQFLIVGMQAGLDIFLSFFGYLGMLWFTCPPLATLALIPIPVWYLALRYYSASMQPLYKKQLDASDEVVRVYTENIAGAHVVRAFCTEDLEKKKFAGAAEHLMERVYDTIFLQEVMLPLLRGIMVYSQIFLFTFGALLVQSGHLSLGGLVIFGVAMGALLGKLQQLNVVADAYQRAVVSYDRVLEILSAPDSTPELEGATRLRQGRGAISLKDVEFGYEPNLPVLRKVNLEIPEGAHVAIVGPIGSGKSTLAALIGRCYDPWQGSVLIDGQDVRTATVRSVRHAVGYVFQENYIFNDTVARNIAYGDLEAPMADIKQAAEAAHAAEFIKRLEQQYDTMLGEYGASLSGGQRQRLAIARALLHNPRVLIMDDALSAVDPETEKEIRASLEAWRGEHTVIQITSRISTARHADRIYVLQDGEIVQQGSHQELIGQPGYYRDVARAQFGEIGGDFGSPQSHSDRVARESRRRGHSG